MTDNRATSPAPQQLTSAELEKVAADGSGAGKVTFNPFSIKK